MERAGYYIAAIVVAAAVGVTFCGVSYIIDFALNLYAAPNYYVGLMIGGTCGTLIGAQFKPRPAR